MERTTEDLKCALFSGGRQEPSSAWLKGRYPKDGFGGWELYSAGFKLAADELVSHLDEETAADHLRHFVVYPIFFLYRHHVELRLKKMAWRYGGTSSIPEKHALLPLWQRVAELMLEFHKSDSYSSYVNSFSKSIENHIRVFDEVDSSSVVFRYPFDSRGELTFSDDILWINLRELKAQVSELTDLLDRFGE